MRRLFMAWGLLCGLSAANIVFAAGPSTAPATDFYLGLKAGGALGEKTLLDRIFMTAAKSERYAYTVPGLKIPFSTGLLSDRESMALARDHGIDAASEDWSTQAFGGYGLFRAGENLYIKGKAGLAHQRINIVGTTLVVDDDRSSMAVGLGAGMRLSNSRMELEYSWFNNANFLSVGYAF